MSQSVSFSEYTESVRVTQNGAVLLAKKLRTCAPRDLDAEERRALKEVETAADGIEEVIVARMRVGSPAVRPARYAVQSAWTAAYEIASAKTRLPPASSGGAAARRVVERFFAHGVPIAGRSAMHTYGISSRLLECVDEGELGAAFVAVVGDELVALMRAATDRLGRTLGARGPVPERPPHGSAVQDGLLRFGRKVGRYCRVLAAKVDEHDPETVQRFRDAVKPIDDMRVRMRPRRARAAPAQPNEAA